MIWCMLVILFAVYPFLKNYSNKMYIFIIDLNALTNYFIYFVFYIKLNENVKK